MFEYLCSDSTSGNLIFDFSIAPSFLYYSYLSIILLALGMGFFVLYTDKKNILNRNLFVISLIYSLFLLNELLHWVLIPVVFVHFAWQISILFHALLFYFVYVFFYNLLFQKDLSFVHRSSIFLLIIPIILLLPTIINIKYFDFELCEGGYSWLWYYVYVIEVIFWVLIGRLSVEKIRVSENRIRDIIFSSATLLFLGIFIITNVWGDSTLVYEVNIFGPIGMLLFILLMMFAIVKYKTFNIKLLGPQVLTFILGFLTFAALFIRKIENIKVILVLNIIATFFIGLLLVRSVKKVDSQKVQLEKINQNQQSLLHFVTHQIKGYLTKSRNIFDGLIHKDYGEISPKALEISTYGFESDTRAVETVLAILRASDLKTGKTKFQKELSNISALVAEVIESKHEQAQAKGLDLTFDIEPNIMIQVDSIQIKEVFKNLIVNAILYTQSGTIKIVLKKDAKHVKFSVIDTGIGLTVSDREKLFTEGGKGEDALKVNVDSTGYGLYVAREIVNKHQGKIGAISEGRGMGSEFFVILPNIQ